MHCEFVLPALIWPDDPMRFAAIAPSLAKLLARGAMQSSPEQCLEEWLLERLSSHSGAAAIALLAEQQGDPGNGHWLRADPVHLSINRDRVVLMDATQLEITADESMSFCASLNEHFHADGMTFFAPDPTRWYLRCEVEPKLQTHALSRVRGRRIDRFGFTGTDRALWQRHLSEAQMLLHNHPINEAREERGAMMVNSLWLWGGGPLPLSGNSPELQIIANHELALGSATRHNLEKVTLTQDASWSHVIRHAKKTLVVLDSLAVPAAYADDETWRSELKVLESTWFAPALCSLQRGTVKSLTLHVLQNNYSLSNVTLRLDLYKFWRSSTMLSATLKKHHDQDH